MWCYSTVNTRGSRISWRIHTCCVIVILSIIPFHYQLIFYCELVLQTYYIFLQLAWLLVMYIIAPGGWCDREVQRVKQSNWSPPPAFPIPYLSYSNIRPRFSHSNWFYHNLYYTYSHWNFYCPCSQNWLIWQL